MEHTNKDMLIALERLRKRLLDLTSRNRLLNFRHTKGSSLRFIDIFPDNLIEMLLAEKELHFKPIPEPTKVQLIKAGYISIDNLGKEYQKKQNPSAAEWAEWLGVNTSYESPQIYADTYNDNSIRTLLYPFEMETKLRNIRQKSESAIEETGANILYIAIGFLKWFETYDSSNARYAPLYLVPIKINKGKLNTDSGTYEYTVNYSGEDIIPNLSLREKMRIDFGLDLPSLDENTKPEKYFKNVEKVINNQPHWKLHRYVTIALLNFSKLLMYLDLDTENWPINKSITDNKFIKSFLAGYNSDYMDTDYKQDLGFGEEYEIDEIDQIHDKYPIIYDADSSQHSALIDAVEGKNLVIEGPPGTGKSQTITNLIAIALSQGKKVLFVAEKLAALEVVKRNLDRVGLGEYCLELHSHKTQKRRFLNEISERLNNKGKHRSPKDIDENITRYEYLKQILKKHVELVNSKWKNTGKTIHQILMSATRFRRQLKINVDIIFPDNFSSSSFNIGKQLELQEIIYSFVTIYKSIVEQLDSGVQIENHPWYGVNNTDLQMFDLDNVNIFLEQWQGDLIRLNEVINQFIQDFNLSEINTTVIELNNLSIEINNLPELKYGDMLGKLPYLQGDQLDNIIKYIDKLDRIQTLYKILSKRVDNSILSDLSSAPTYLDMVAILKDNVIDNISLSVLYDAINIFKNINSQLIEVEPIIHEIQKTIGSDPAQYIKLSKYGLSELKIFIELVSSLNPSLSKYRDGIFDNNENDQILPKLRDEIYEIKTAQRKLGKYFDIRRLPDEITIVKWRNTTLRNRGLLKWLKPSWRRTRKDILMLRTYQNIKYNKLVSLLNELAILVHKEDLLTNNTTYRELLGKYFQDINTDIESFIELREWYKKVRAEYGYGFGLKNKVGDAIINLPIETIQAIRSLKDRAIIEQLDSILDDLKHLENIFKPFTELNSRNINLLDFNGLLGIINNVEKALRYCEPIINNDKMSLSKLYDTVRALNNLKKEKYEWENISGELYSFRIELNLQAGIKKSNDNILDIVRSTLEFANHLDKKCNEPILKKVLYSRPVLSTVENIKSFGDTLKYHLSKENESRSSFSNIVSLSLDRWTKISGDTIESIINRNNIALESSLSLQNMLDYIRARKQLYELGFNRLVDIAEIGDIKIDQFNTTYYASIYGILAREIFREEPDLARFSGNTQESYRKQFKEYDEKLKYLQCEKIAWTIDQKKVPTGKSGARVIEFTDRRLLERECQKKRRHIPIRQLMKRASNALISLKPCFLMGPMSVAQYLEPGQLEFDIIIMDEASQIKPEDAIGAIARGKQVVVVGDPKQLPPTNFFDRILDDEDQEDELTAIEDSESILDAAMTTFQARRLRWHYRSQHESLIAFSNYSFYDNDLVLFPSPHKESNEYGVKYIPVKRGCFINNRNKVEAQMVADEIRRHFLTNSNETLGVVAMNIYQRELIERSLEVLAKEDPFLQEKLDNDQNQDFPLFIKNLENVQGDERDVIFISMTYGPSEPGGQVMQRFGPINLEFGWRRLNVLFTRSKKRMHVFSSMNSDDIKLSLSTKDGVKALRDFLAYCETGILHDTKVNSDRPPDSDFEIAVAEALKKEGFETVLQLGEAGFFIDLAVIDPGKPGRFLMGIECDGATYHSAKSVRDRDRLRQEILERLGWRIRRIWSTDWFKNPDLELKPIIRELHDYKTIVPIKDIPKSKPVIDEIIGVQEAKSKYDSYLSGKGSLKDKLLKFDREVIRKEIPHSAENERLLRPAMLNALIEYMPTNKSEFLERIPFHLRDSIDPDEGIFLDNIFEIINLENPVS